MADAAIIEGEQVQEQIKEPETGAFLSSVPTDWRTQVLAPLKLDPKELAKRSGQLERISDISSLVKNYFEGQDTIHRGVLPKIPERPSEIELVAEFRKEHGIPETPDGYQVKLAEGLVLSERDQRVMDHVFKTAHQENLTNAQMIELTNAVQTGNLLEDQKEYEELMDRHANDRKVAEQAMRELWGGDYTPNMNLVNAALAYFPAEIQENVRGAVAMDGRALLNIPEVLMVFADWQRKINPLATVVPSGGGIQAAEEEIKKYEGMMRDDMEAWHRNPEAQKRYMDLLQARIEHNKA